ncbi:hypothetical protein [Chryseobacterium sp. MYb328]
MDKGRESVNFEQKNEDKKDSVLKFLILDKMDGGAIKIKLIDQEIYP